jgi:predicted AlkP superfamily pyrophosphatase or phosphodiesterase
LATNFKSKVIGIAIKDRGGILPAGHSANAAYWYDASTGNWVTSTYYMNDLPGWVKKFNDRKVVDSFYRLDWNTLYPVNTYVQSDVDDRPYEGKTSFDPKPAFPHLLSAQAGKNYNAISGTPHGSTFTLEFAKLALVAEEMGNDAVTDFLAVSLSSPDYTGHQYGPSSIEVEDTYLRLDNDLANFFAFLDAKVGKGQYLFFITADHGVANVAGFMQDHKIPAGTIPYGKSAAENAAIKKFGRQDIVEGADNYQLYLNHKIMDSAKLDAEQVQKFLIDELNQDPNVLLAFDNRNINAANLPKEVKEMFIKGYNTKLGGDIQMILKPQYYYGGNTGTTHGSWYPYDAHIPLVWMGWGIKPGKLYRETYMTDIASTIAAMLKIQMPNGSVGKVIEEVIK